MSDTTDALESLLVHPGWLLFVDHAKTEWGPLGYGRKVKQAVADARARNEDAAAAVDKVDYANDHIGDMLGWPKQELARLKRHEHEPIADDLATMSRRGSL